MVGYVLKYQEPWDGLFSASNDTVDNAFANALLLLRGWHAGEPEMAMVLGSCPMLFTNEDHKHYTPRLPERTGRGVP